MSALKFYQTVGSGSRAEKQVADILARHTQYVYKNIRIPTLYTESAETEIDIIAAIDDFLLVVEVKNCRNIEGDSLCSYWKLEGNETGETYTSLSFLTQNRIHVKALKDAWRVARGDTPLVMSLIVVPNGCNIPCDLKEAGVLTVGEFEQQLHSLAVTGKYSVKPKYGYALDFIVDPATNRIKRKDFV